MDHRVSKDMISQGMSVKGEKTTEHGTSISFRPDPDPL